MQFVRRLRESTEGAFRGRPAGRPRAERSSAAEPPPPLHIRLSENTTDKLTERRIAIKELTSKEKLFCTYYCINRNGRESAVKSGYMFPEKSAVKLLRRRDITEEIARIDKQREATQRDIAIGYQRLAFGCISDAICLLFSDEVSRQEIEKMDLFNISEIKRKKGGDIEIKFFDRLKALEKLGDIWSTQRDDEESSLYSAIEKGAKALQNDNYE